jgi:nuclease S1
MGAHAVLAITILVVFASQARAWSRAGHEIVADIAQRYLAPHTQSAVAALLQPGEHLRDVANWADAYREQCANTGPWHYVNIPLAADSFEPARDCSEPRSCVIVATDRALAILADVTSPPDERAAALRFVVHFMGDLHQPLHSGDRADRGGNDLQVWFAGEETNLHAVWDYMLIASTRRTVADYVAKLTQAPNAAASRWSRGTVADWAIESQRAARRVYSNLPRPRNERIQLGPKYVAAVLPIVDAQLLRAGVRLASALDAAFAQPGPAVSEEQRAAAKVCVPPAPH